MLRNPPADAGDTGDVGLTPGLGRVPGVGSGTHSSILVWEVLNSLLLFGLLILHQST